MDYFESICKTLLEKEGYWVKQSYKIELTREDKIKLNSPSLPRLEIDLIAFNYKKNELLVLEVKSFFDSGGVMLRDLQKEHLYPEGRYKLVTCQNYREIVERQIKKVLFDTGLVPENIQTKFGLIFGNVRVADDAGIRHFCTENNWFYWSPQDVQEKVLNLASNKYENDPCVITAKILNR